MGLWRPLVEHGPQHVEHDGFGEIVVDAHAERALHVAGNGIGREGDHRRPRPLGMSLLMATDRLAQRIAVHLRHVEVGQQQGIAAVLPALQTLHAVARDLGGPAEQRQLLQDHLLVDGIVLGHEDQSPARARLLHGRCAALPRQARVPFALLRIVGVASGSHRDSGHKPPAANGRSIDAHHARPVGPRAAPLAARDRDVPQAGCTRERRLDPGASRGGPLDHHHRFRQGARDGDRVLLIDGQFDRAPAARSKAAMSSTISSGFGRSTQSTPSR